jgi:hypothetical protein
MSTRDYSLSDLPVRLAVEGEELAVHRFATGSTGLVRPSDLQSSEPAQRRISARSLWDRAVCRISRYSPPPQGIQAIYVPPGADVILKNIPADLRQRYGIEEVEGAKVALAESDADPDAIQLHNGCRLLLRNLPVGMRLELLSLATAYRPMTQWSDGRLDSEPLALQTAVSGLYSAIRRCIGKCKWKTRKAATPEPAQKPIKRFV